MLLLLAGIGCGVFFGGLAVYGQLRGGGSIRGLRWWIPLGVLAFGVAAGLGAYWIDHGEARTTLFEVDAEGSLGVKVTDPAAPVRQFDLPVEHPGVEHELLIDPITGDPAADARNSVQLYVRLDDPAGRPLIDQELLFDAECDRNRCGWRSWTAHFTPQTAEVYRLTVVVLTIDIPKVHVRVEDPEKTDGARAPGY